VTVVVVLLPLLSVTTSVKLYDPNSGGSTTFGVAVLAFVSEIALKLLEVHR